MLQIPHRTVSQHTDTDRQTDRRILVSPSLYVCVRLPSSAGSSCERACRANDKLAAATETAFAEYASACATDSALFAHCTKDDSEVDVAKCVREACGLCCQTSAHHPLATGEERQWETDTCKQQCKAQHDGGGANTPLLTSRLT